MLSVGTPAGRYSIIYQDNLADTYLEVFKRRSVVRASIFDITNEFTESIHHVLTTLCKVKQRQGVQVQGACQS